MAHRILGGSERKLGDAALAEVTPVRGDDEKQTGERERDTCDDRSSGTKFELRDLRRGEPDPSEQDEQESDLGEAHARLMRQSKEGSCAVLFLPRYFRVETDRSRHFNA